MSMDDDRTASLSGLSGWFSQHFGGHAQNAQMEIMPHAFEAHFDTIVKEVMQTFENVRLELILEGVFSRDPDQVLDLERYRQNFNSPIYEMNFHAGQFSLFWDRVTQHLEQNRTERQRDDDPQPTERGIDR